MRLVAILFVEREPARIEHESVVFEGVIGAMQLRSGRAPRRVLGTSGWLRDGDGWLRRDQRSAGTGGRRAFLLTVTRPATLSVHSIG